MFKRVYAIPALTAGLFLCFAAAAAASETSVGAAILFTHGTHKETRSTITAPLIPAPVFSIDHRGGRFEVLAEGLPPIGPLPVNNDGYGIRSIKLSYFDATVRYWNAANTFAVGAGETIYNQQTAYAVVLRPSIFEYQSSRVTGMRYEALGRSYFSTRAFLEASLAVNPSMRAVEYATISAPHAGSPPGLPEAATQVVAQVRYERRYTNTALTFGIQYLNYSARYTARYINGRMADRNTFVMPFVGIRQVLGR